MDNIKVFYVRNEWNNRDITIVSNLQKIDGKFVVSCGWSFRSNHDKFVKKEGRRVATERMNDKDPIYSASFEIEDPKFKTISVNILDIIYASPNTPKKYLEDIAYDIMYLSQSVNWKTVLPRNEKPF